jgi:hypothetical protein
VERPARLFLCGRRRAQAQHRSSRADPWPHRAVSNRHADLLFELGSRRYERKSTLITTNRECGAPHSRFNAESILKLSLLFGTPFQLIFDGSLLRIKELGFSARMSLP